ncbi:MAG: rhodanese-like domain-containing protein [Pseudomonadales bacterium]
MIRFSGLILLVVTNASTAFAGEARIPNPNIDYQGFKILTQEVQTLREARRVSESQFIEMSKDRNTLILDSRSAAKFAQMHVAGAVNVAFSDMTEQTLGSVIASKGTRILIYCNNNFVNAPGPFPTKISSAALNVPTFITLSAYGYDNVYELGPVVEPGTSAIEFSSESALKAPRRAASGKK